MQCNNSCSVTSKFCFEWNLNTALQFLCYELRSIKRGTSERRGTGELCSIINVHSTEEKFKYWDMESPEKVEHPSTKE